MYSSTIEPKTARQFALSAEKPLVVHITVVNNTLYIGSITVDTSSNTILIRVDDNVHVLGELRVLEQ